MIRNRNSHNELKRSTKALRELVCVYLVGRFVAQTKWNRRQDRMRVKLPMSKWREGVEQKEGQDSAVQCLYHSWQGPTNLSLTLRSSCLCIYSVKQVKGIHKPRLWNSFGLTKVSTNRAGSHYRKRASSHNTVVEKRIKVLHAQIDDLLDNGVLIS